MTGDEKPNKEGLVINILLFMPVQKQYATEDFEKSCMNHNLTPRETEIAVLVGKGKINKEIAEELHISAKTVGRHLQNMFEKMDVSNRSELINKLRS